MLKSWSKQLSGALPLDIALPEKKFGQFAKYTCRSVIGTRQVAAGVLCIYFSKKQNCLPYC